MLPLRDDNPTQQVPYVTYGLMAVCVAVYLYQMGLSPREDRTLILALGMIPAVVLGDETLPPDLAMVPALATPITSMFLHGGFFHLAGNMLYLWIFGNNVEDAMGSLRFLAFYVICGLAAALVHGLQAADSVIPMVGASGAISGVLGAYLLLFPWARVFVWFGFVFVFWVPAALVLGLWFAFQAFGLLEDPGGVQSGVAFWAHLGGFVAGMMLIPLFKHRSVPLFSHRRAVSRVSVIPATGRRSGRHKRGPWDDPPSGPWGARRP